MYAAEKEEAEDEEEGKAKRIANIAKQYQQQSTGMNIIIINKIKQLFKKLKQSILTFLELLGEQYKETEEINKIWIERKQDNNDNDGSEEENKEMDDILYVVKCLLFLLHSKMFFSSNNREASQQFLNEQRTNNEVNVVTRRRENDIMNIEDCIPKSHYPSTNNNNYSNNEDSSSDYDSDGFIPQIDGLYDTHNYRHHSHSLRPLYDDENDENINNTTVTITTTTNNHDHSGDNNLNNIPCFNVNVEDVISMFYTLLFSFLSSFYKYSTFR